MSRNRDIDTILNAFAKVKVWNDTIISLATPIPISPKLRVLSYMHFFVGT